jgi:hypothetical protein
MKLALAVEQRSFQIHLELIGVAADLQKCFDIAEVDKIETASDAQQDFAVLLETMAKQLNSS